MNRRTLALAWLVLGMTVLAPLSGGATTVTGTVKRPDGTNVTGTIEFTLSQLARVSGTAWFVPVKTTCTVTNGAIGTCTVQGNDTLDPAGTFYTVRIVDTNNLVVMPATDFVINGASVDLSTLVIAASATLQLPSGNVTGNLQVSGDLVISGFSDLGTFSQLDCGTAPGTPAAGNARFYCKSSDKRFYGKDDAGAEFSMGGGITSLGGQTGATQTFSDIDDTNVTLTISSAANNHGFTLGWTGVLAASKWSPLTTEGDLIFRDATTTTRLPRGTNGQCLTSSATTILWGSCGGGSTFLSLSDTPASYSGQGGNYLRVNATPDALEFRTPANVLTDIGGISASSTATLTNKTLDVEGTGNVVTTVPKATLIAAGCNNATAAPGFDLPTSLAPTAACYGTSPHRYGSLDFPDGASDLTAVTHFKLPSDWTGAIDISLYWACTAATCSTNNMIWGLQTVCIANAEAWDAPTYNAVQDITDAGLATLHQRNEATQTGVTATGCAAGETLFLKIIRRLSQAGDTFAGTAGLLEVEVAMRRAQ